MKKGFIKILVFLVVFSFLVYSPLPAQKKAQKVNLKDFSAYVERTMKEWKVPGLAIAIVKDGKVIFAEGFGFRDVKKGLKVTPQTLFAIGSSSKAFTATTMGILVDEGKLDWDKPVSEYLPTFKLKDLFASERMSPRDLVCHRSGLPRHDSIWYGAQANRKELFNRIQYLEPSRDFRTYFQYQNLMFMTAGYLVGQIAGTTWEDFTQKHIFEPLGMNNSNFSVEDSKKAADFALPYLEKEDKAMEIPFRNIDNVGPAGSINSNVTDMVNWVLLQLNKGKCGEKQIISEATLKQLHTPQMVMQDSMFPGFEKFTELHYTSYGLGWFIDSYKGHLLIHHAGGIDGFTALVSFMPRDNLGMVALSNLNGNPLPYFVAFNAYDRLLGLEQTPWNKRVRELLNKTKEQAKKTEKEKDKDRKLNTKPSHPLEGYVGDYEHPGYGVISIKKEGDNLKAAYNAISAPLTHYHYDIFKLRDEMFERTMKVTFFMDLKGNIHKLAAQLEPSVDDIIFTRMPEKKMQERSFLEKFVGEYDLQGITVTIFLKGENALFASVPGQGEVELVPYKGTEFNLKNLSGFSIEFIMDETGVVTEAKVTQPNGAFTAKKK
ncbi:MAG: serine hydrolase [Candidatus Aminicenantes bacterium]|nr:MAG: serine hydrolase [Candidatus Aminicenantes bacterium]